MLRLLVVLAVSAIATAPFAQSASAAAISKFSYTVTGGSFYGFSVGPITGGTASFTPTTPVLSSADATIPGTIKLTLTGPSGFFQLLPFDALRPPSFVGARWCGAGTLFCLGLHASRATIRAISVSHVFSPVGGGTGSSARARFRYDPVFPTAGHGEVFAPWGGGCVVGGGHSRTACPEPLRHTFAIGNEVRTVVPEPTTATLLGVGLLALALGGGGAAGARRQRRR